MYRGKNRLRRALLELREDLDFSNWMQLWRAADVASNYSHWDKLMRSKTTPSFKKEMIEEFIKGFERKGYPLTADQQKRLHATIFGTDEFIDRNDQLELLKNLDPHHLVDSHIDNFVLGTRQAEIIEAAKRIKALRSRGGYLIITGQAGEGKSSLIIQLINVAFRLKEIKKSFLLM